MTKIKIWVLLAVASSAALFSFFIYSLFYLGLNDFPWFSDVSLEQLADLTYYSTALPLLLVALLFTGTGFWIGWTILAVKVVGPMPEKTKKKDYHRAKAFLLCLVMALISAALVYGVYIRSFWALALPALAISAVVLGSLFWVGLTIMTTKAAVPTKTKQEETA